MTKTIYIKIWVYQNLWFGNPWIANNIARISKKNVLIWKINHSWVFVLCIVSIKKLSISLTKNSELRHTVKIYLASSTSCWKYLDNKYQSQHKASG